MKVDGDHFVSPSVAETVCEPTESVLVIVPLEPHVGVLEKYWVRAPTFLPSIVTAVEPVFVVDRLVQTAICPVVDDSLGEVTEVLPEAVPIEKVPA